ncbi:MAG: SH3 domain-containing protein [Deltaproteobacteria bacterium]|nr:SH3 domain-containing protein [Deltaproteobacteria bacterium]
MSSFPASLLLVLALAAGCKTGSTSHPPFPRPCPKEAPGPAQLPDVRDEQLHAAYWIALTPHAQALLLDGQGLAEHNKRLQALKNDDGWPVGRDATATPNGVALDQRIHGDLVKLREAIKLGKRLAPDGSKPRDLLRQVENAVATIAPVDEWRVALRGSSLRCYPSNAPLYDEPWADAFDMLQCSYLRFGEVVRVLRKSSSFWYVRTSYSGGWVDPHALGPPLPAEQLSAYTEATRFFVITRADAAVISKPDGPLIGIAKLGLTLPLADQPAANGLTRVVIPTTDGLGSAWVASSAGTDKFLPLTRASVWKTAFRLLHQPYSWGGIGGGRDCSRMLMDVFDAHGLHLPRNSWQQSQAGVSSVDVENQTDRLKGQAISAAAERGILLLYFPGHIMLYLGQDRGKHYALHQFSGYLVPCKDGGETMVRANRVTVTTLELGRGSSRRSFIERLTRIVIIGANTSKTSPTSTATNTQSY